MSAKLSKSSGQSRRAVQALACLVVAGLASSCSMFDRTPHYEDVLELELVPSQTEWQPGEALVVTAQLKNVGENELVVRQLNADSLMFWWWSEANASPLIRQSVFSPEENLALTSTMPKDGLLKRNFAFTDVTEEAGNYYIQAIYRTPVEGKEDSPMVVSEPVAFKVGGERLFSRGEDGLIEKASAITLAEEYLGRPVVAERAKLIKNEAGVYDWWVTVEVAPEALAKGERAAKGFFVNPYIGFIRKEAKPYDAAVNESADEVISQNAKRMPLRASDSTFQNSEKE